jgi:dolichyl-phosphate-mannose-protein mannosyltransferase
VSPEFPLNQIIAPLLFTVGICAGYTYFLFRFLRRDENMPPSERGEITPPVQPVERADALIAATLAVSFYLLCLWRLGTPTEQYFDEVHHVRAAAEYQHGLDPHEWTHPPLAKLMMAGSMNAWGSTFDPRDNIWKPENKYTEKQTIGWRFPSVVFGALSLAFLYALTRSLFGNRTIAIQATTLLGLDGLFFVQSRIAMTNIYTVCFILAGTLGTWLYIKHRKRRWLLLTGFALGLSLATRWTSLWAWGLNGLLLLWNLWVNERPRWQKEEKGVVRPFLLWAASVIGAMIVIPFFLYFLAYVPNVLQSDGDLHRKLFTMGENGPINWSGVFTTEVRAYGRGWFKILNLQGDMWRYHTEIKEGHPYSSPWWSWPLMLRPTWYYFQSPEGRVSGIWAIGNAFIWWASVGSLSAMVALLGFGMWLAWAIKPRPLIFMHYLFESIPFVCIALAYLWWRLNQMPGEGPKRFAQWHFGLIAAWFVYYFPLLSALPIPGWYFNMHLWLGRLWI